MLEHWLRVPASSLMLDLTRDMRYELWGFSTSGISMKMSGINISLGQKGEILHEMGEGSELLCLNMWDCFPFGSYYKLLMCCRIYKKARVSFEISRRDWPQKMMMNGEAFGDYFGKKNSIFWVLSQGPLNGGVWVHLITKKVFERIVSIFLCYSDSFVSD